MDKKDTDRYRMKAKFNADELRDDEQLRNVKPAKKDRIAVRILSRNETMKKTYNKRRISSDESESEFSSSDSGYESDVAKNFKEHLRRNVTYADDYYHQDKKAWLK